MEMQKNVTCLIPHYNEGQRLDGVLDEIVKMKNLAEVICVDDGSSIDRTEELKLKYPSVSFIRLDQNVGKTGAVEAGLKSVKSEWTMMIDADLQGLDHQELQKAVKAINSKEMDMLILRRKNPMIAEKVTRGDLLYTGERILRTMELIKILASKKVVKWQLESAINSYMYQNKKIVKWMYHSGRNLLKMQKIGVKYSIMKDPRTFYDIVTGTENLREFLKIMFYFCKRDQKIDLEAEAVS